MASLHPLFGPEVTTLAGRVIAVLDCGNPGAADDAAALFRDTALTITRLPVEAHDACMQYVLGLSHLVSILFFTTLVRGRRPFDELAAVASTTFYKQAGTAPEVARENPQLYHEIHGSIATPPGCSSWRGGVSMRSRPRRWTTVPTRSRTCWRAAGHSSPRPCPPIWDRRREGPGDATSRGDRPTRVRLWCSTSGRRGASHAASRCRPSNAQTAAPQGRHSRSRLVAVVRGCCNGCRFSRQSPAWIGGAPGNLEAPPMFSGMVP